MSFPFLLLSLVLLLFPQSGNDLCGCEDKPQVNTLAVVNGIKITKQELGSTAQNQIGLLQNEIMKARDTELDRQINRYLLEAEAKRRGLTAEQFVKLEVTDRIPTPTDVEARAFYDQRKERMPEDFKNAKPKIIALLKSQREQIAAVKLVNLLRSAANVTVLLPNVTPPKNSDELNRVFAKAGGRTFTSRDIEAGLAPLIFAVQQKVYLIRKEDLDMRINDLLLEQEAKRLHSTPATVLANAIRAKLSIVTDQQAKAYYNENKATMQGDFDKVKFQIIQFLTQKQQEQLSNEFAQQLRQNAAVQIYLTPPEPPKPLASTP
jgi:hypothetical protein